MATTVDTLLVRIDADLQGLKKGLRDVEKQTSQSQKRVSQNMGKIGLAVKGALGVASIAIIGRFIAKTVQLGSAVEEMQAKSSVVFGKFVGDVRKELETFGNEVGRSTFALEGMAASVQDTFVPMGFARGEAAQLSTQLTKLAVDVASFNNASDVDTMNAFQSALVGNHETVRRFGVVITEAELKAELFRMGITKNSADVDAATKVQARLNLILAGTTDAHGDAARTSGSYANQSKALSAALDELLVNVITPLLPALSGMVGGLVDATNAFNKFLESVGIIDTLTQQERNFTRLAEIEAELTVKTKELTQAQKDLDDAAQGTNLQDLIGNIFPKLADGSEKSANAVIGGAERLGGSVATLKAEIAALKAEAAAFAEAERMLTKKQSGTSSTPPIVPEDGPKATALIKDLAQQNRFLDAELHNVSASVIEQSKAMLDAGDATEAQYAMIVKLFDAQEKLNKEIEAKDDEGERNQKIKGSIDELSKANQILALEKMGLSEVEKQLEEQRIIMGGLNAEQEKQLRSAINDNIELTDAINQATNATDAYNQKVNEGVGIANSFTPEAEKIREQIAALDAAFVAGKISVEEYTRAQEGLAMKLAETDPMFAAFKNGAEKAGNAVADSLADGLVEGKIALDDFKDIFKSFVKELIAEAIRTYIIKKILASVFGGLAGGGSVNATPATEGSFAGGGNIPRRATGGPVLVGERGPELFIPHSGGVIKNNMDTKNMLGGQTTVVNQTLNIETGVSQTVRAEITSLLPQIKQNTIAAVIDQRRRGGSLANAFGA